MYRTNRAAYKSVLTNLQDTLVPQDEVSAMMEKLV